MKLQKIIGASIIATAFASPIAMAQSQDTMSNSSQSVQSQQGQMQGQPQVRQSMPTKSQIKEVADQKVQQVDREYDLDLTSEQAQKLSESMTDFQLDQQNAENPKDIKEAAEKYEENVNNVFTDEQKEKIKEAQTAEKKIKRAKDAQKDVNRGQELGNVPNQN